jgi:hypothetical protein
LVRECNEPFLAHNLDITGHEDYLTVGVADRPIHTVNTPIQDQEYRIANIPVLVIVKAPGPG